MSLATHMQTNNRVGRILRTITLLFLGTAAAYSQTQSLDPLRNMVFSGHVTDATGASIPKATISLDAKGKPILLVIADQTGHFAIEARPGEYTLRVLSPGFATYHQSINFADATSIEKDIVLQVASCSPCLEVLSGPQIELLDASLTSTLTPNPLPPLKPHKHTDR